MPSRVLVTGGAGFIGSHLVRHLLRAGSDVVVLDDLTTGLRENLPSSRRLGFVHGSVESRTDVTLAVRGCDTVYHLAGVVGMRLATAQQQRAYRVAAEGTRNVLDLCGSTRVIAFSSSAVYGHAANVPTHESAVCSEDECLRFDGGSDGYASGKLELEHRVQHAAASGRRVLVVRPFNVIGPRQSAAYGMVLPTFIDSARRGAPMRVYDDGAQTRSFSDAHTFVRCVVSLASQPAAFEYPMNVFNVGSPAETSVLEVARSVQRALHIRSPVSFVPYATAFPGREDVRRRCPDVRRMEGVLGPVAWPRVMSIVARMVRPGVSTASAPESVAAST